MSRKVLGSIEYGCAVAGAKLVLVLGHTRCGAVSTAVTYARSTVPAAEETGCQHVEHILREIQESIDQNACREFERLSKIEQEDFVNGVACANVMRTVEMIVEQSQTLANLVQDGKIVIVGAMYDVVTGDITFSTETPSFA